MFKSNNGTIDLNIQHRGRRYSARVNNATPPAANDDDVPWLTDEERTAWVTLTAMLMSLPAAVDTQLRRDSGLNFFEYSILVGLSRPAGRAVRMSSLALLAGGSPSRLSHAVSRLERQGWVRRKSTGDGVRCIEAVLTDEGMAVLREAAPGHVREVRRLVFDPLSATQVRQLARICRQLLDAAAPDMGAAVDVATAGEREVAAREAALESACGPALESACGPVARGPAFEMVHGPDSEPAGAPARENQT
jgi:DNA-binding MarR family transcriptional regulator